MSRDTELLQKISDRLGKVEKELRRIKKIDEEELRDRKWLCEYLGITPRTSNNYILFKNLPYIKLNGVNSKLYFRKSEVDEWLNKNREIKI